MAEIYGDLHPELINRRAELKDFRQKSLKNKELAFMILLHRATAI